MPRQGNVNVLLAPNCEMAIVIPPVNDPTTGTKDAATVSRVTEDHHVPNSYVSMDPNVVFRWSAAIFAIVRPPGKAAIATSHDVNPLAPSPSLRSESTVANVRLLC